MKNGKDPHENIVDLSQQRRQRNLLKRTLQKAKHGATKNGAPMAKTPWRFGYSSSKVVTFIQTIIFLLAMTYLMQLCQGG